MREERISNLLDMGINGASMIIHNFSKLVFTIGNQIYHLINEQNMHLRDKIIEKIVSPLLC